MSNVWVLMYNVEVPTDDDWQESSVAYSTITTSKPIRVYQQRATAFAKMEQANIEAGDRDSNGNNQYYSIEEVAYV